MKEELIENVMLQMLSCLDNIQIKKLKQVLEEIFNHCEVIESENIEKDDSVIRKFLITADDGKPYNTNHYSLEMIISLEKGSRITWVKD